MSVKKFKFVSPGIFINEIDNSQLTKTGDDIGPVIIGTALRGPSMVPTRIESFSDFVETFGEPLSGSEGSDVWREGNRLAPTYAAYAAQAYLRNASPVTFVRLLGQAHPDGSDHAGWLISDPSDSFDAAGDGAAGAYGLFISNGQPGGSAAKGTLTIDSSLEFADLGFTVTVDEGGGAVTEIAEVSARHRAIRFQIDSVPSGGGNNVSLDISLSDGSIVSFNIGDDGLADAGSNINTTGVATNEALATKLAERINSLGADGLEASNVAHAAPGAETDVITIRAVDRDKSASLSALGATTTGAALILTGLASGGATQGGVDSVVAVAGSFKFDNDDFSGAAFGDETAAGTVSIAQAIESTTGNFGVPGSSQVSQALVSQIVALGTLSTCGHVLTKDSALVVNVTSTAAGVDASPDVIASAAGSITGSTMSAGSADTFEGQTGALAAIIYAKSGAVSLLGSAVSDDAQTLDGINSWVRSDGAGNQFKLRARNTASGASDVTNKEDIAFNFNKNSRLYIRNVLNTNPTLCDANISGDARLKAYFLGETFDRHLAEVQDGLATAKGQQFACLMPLAGAGNQASDASGALTPWIISQHNGNPSDFDTSDASLLASGAVENLGIEKLLRFHSLYAGQWERKNLKVAIEDIKAPTDKFNPYGTFSVVVRRAFDSDAAPQVVERFSACNLNPASVDYVGKKVGDMNMIWDDDERRYVSHGQFENQSRFLRVEVSDSVESGLADPRLLPFGFLGPRKRKDVVFDNNAGNGTVTVDGGDITFIDKEADSAVKFCDGAIHTDAAGKITIGPINGGADTTHSVAAFEVTLKFPQMSLRASSADSSLSSPRDANFGISVSEKGSSTVFDESYMDLAGFAGYSSATSDPTVVDGSDNQHQFIFTLDDIRLATTKDEGYNFAPSSWSSPNAAIASKPKNFVWEAGARANDDSTPAETASLTAYTPATGIPGGFEAVLNAGIRSFTVPLVGGHDGVDIFQVHPFAYHANASANESLADGDASALTHYALNSLKKAVDAVADPEVVDMNLLAAPGMTHPSITNHMISVCEKRGDALAVIDIDYDYMPRGLDVDQDEAARMPNVDKAIDSLRQRSLNSSYGCTFFPWVQIADTMSGRVLWAPPSVAAIGTMASSSRRSELWFAPAGFTRGGLTDGAAGLPVSSVRLRLNSKERDKLYEANINPIAQFPAEGIVIFGQKTLQVTPSALDRINVRRLMIFLKKSISRMAKTVLFDQNVESTWARFTSQAEPFLASVKSRFGLSEYRIILDKTTTTAELVDRNIMYAKILLKPTRAIEYIAIDFVITDSGASFDD